MKVGTVSDRGDYQFARSAAACAAERGYTGTGTKRCRQGPSGREGDDGGALAAGSWWGAARRWLVA